MNPESADEFLIEQIRQGSEPAWRQLIDRFHGRLLAFAKARVASLSDAEDIVQDTLVGFLQSLAHYDPSRSLETYLFTIVRYKLVDRLRSRKVIPLNPDASEEDWWDQVSPTEGETPSGAALAAEALARREQTLVSLLRQLIRDYRDRNSFEDLQVIELLFYAGRRNLDVAELLEMDQKSVAGVKFRAIGKLRKFLEEQDDEGIEAFDDEHAEVTVARVWRDHRITCLKRSTLGSYLLGVLEEPWLSYTQFHLDVVSCPMCLANVSDIQEQELAREDAGQTCEQLFASSVGFLSRTHPGLKS